MADKFYYYEGQKVPLVRSQTKSAARLVTSTEPSARTAASAAFGGSVQAAGLDLGQGLFLFEHPQRRANGPRALQQGRELEVFEGPSDTPMIVTEHFVAEFKANITKQQIDALNAKHGVTIERQLGNLPNTYVLRAKAEGASALELANAYQESGEVVYAHPDFVRVMKPSWLPNDELFTRQWPLRNTGQGGGTAGHDISAVAAWDVTRGSSSITIAVIDEGVDYDHPDLSTPGKLVTGYNAETRVDDPRPQNNDAHGTSCAGIAAAAGNNGLGICGVAPGCRLMGIRIAHGVGTSWVTSDAIIADGISTAAARGADVLSNSWGGGSPSTAITNAIRWARTNGRGGRGCLIVFAAGNDNGPVSYPGNLPEVITVAACNEFGEAKTPTSRDGENWWGSNLGPRWTCARLACTWLPPTSRARAATIQATTRCASTAPAAPHRTSRASARWCSRCAHCCR